MEHKCIFCSAWNHSHVTRKTLRSEDSEDEKKTKRKKKKKKRSSSDFKRRCHVTKKTIDINSKSCKKFIPQGFYCDNHGIYLKFIQCLNRRRNESNLSTYEACKKCRQFEQEIKDVIIDYFIDGKKPYKKPKEVKRKIKRRTPRRKIKRRESTKTTRKTIKRRKKTDIEKYAGIILKKTKQKRSIKRREKCEEKSKGERTIKRKEKKRTIKRRS